MAHQGNDQFSRLYRGYNQRKLFQPETKRAKQIISKVHGDTCAVAITDHYSHLHKGDQAIVSLYIIISDQS